MHAVSQGAEPAKAPCIYAQLEGSSLDEDEEDDDIHSGPNDIRLIPADAACRASCCDCGLAFALTAIAVGSCRFVAVQDIFQKMCDCAALNPDSDMEGRLSMHLLQIAAQNCS